MIGPEIWHERLALENRLRAKILSRPAILEDARKLVYHGLNRIPILTVIDRNSIEAAASAAETCAIAAASVLCAQRSQGEAILTWPGSKTHSIPAQSDAVPPFDWLCAVACGLLVRDEASLAILCRPSSIAAAQRPEHQSDTFWPFLCAAVGAVIQNAGAAGPWLQETKPLLDQIVCADPKFVRHQIIPLLPVLAALSGNGDWNTSARGATESYFEMPFQPADPQQLLPIAICGLTALALDRGIARDPANLPEELVRGNFPRNSVNVAFRYPTRFAEHPDDPIVLLDLEGISPAERRHTLVEQDGHLIARYRTSDSSIDFILPKEGEQRGDFPPALDPGERVLAADFYASKEDKAAVQDAIQQLDLVLNTIPSEADAVPREAFLNPAGRRAYAQEPGRFRRDRLRAYRNKLAKIEDPELDAYIRAMAAAEVVKAGLDPLLSQFPEVAPELRPQVADYQKVFEPQAVAAAREAYETLWSEPMDLDAPKTEMQIFVSPAGMLLRDNDLSRPFPTGYRAIAHLLQPQRVWAAWKYPNGFLYDGLVWCDDHWSWFPKPYRVLRSLLSAKD